MNKIIEAVRDLLGIGAEDLGVWQMVLRAIVVYVIAIIIIRLGKKRFMGRATAFDLLLTIVLGSIVARVITGDAPFVPGLAATLALVAMHWLFSAIGLRWHGFDQLVKGNSRRLVHNGEVDWDEMRKTHMTAEDLREDLRDRGVSDPGEVAEARLERSGKVSVIKKE